MLAITALFAFVNFASGFSIYDTERVVNGTTAKPGEIPYIVSLRYQLDHSCGASVLDETHVLTAAHCVNDVSVDRLAIQYGVTTILSVPENVIPVKEVYSHENFSSNSVPVKNDIAVLNLEKPLTFSEYVQPVVLPQQNEKIPGNSWAILAGWGLLYTNGPSPKYLQKADILVFTPEDCQNAIPEVTPDYGICGGLPGGGRGQCSQDSGSPLVANGKQIGVVSWSYKPCTQKGPGVYARVSSYLNWIKEKTTL